MKNKGNYNQNNNQCVVMGSYDDIAELAIFDVECVEVKQRDRDNYYIGVVCKDGSSWDGDFIVTYDGRLTFLEEKNLGVRWNGVAPQPEEEVVEDEPAEDDPVNHPSHYTADPSGIECIEITQHRNFCVGNAIKYLWRAGLKEAGSSEKQVEDLQKAIWYINQEIKRLGLDSDS